MARTGKASTEEKERLRRERIRATMKERVRSKFRETGTGRFERRKVEVSYDYRVVSRYQGRGRKQPGWSYIKAARRVMYLASEDEDEIRLHLDEAAPSRSHYNVRVSEESEDE
jgi:hypothetical protein